jgi:hypothetical protein
VSDGIYNIIYDVYAQRDGNHQTDKFNLRWFRMFSCKRFQESSYTQSKLSSNYTMNRLSFPHTVNSCKEVYILATYISSETAFVFSRSAFLFAYRNS